MYLPAARWVGLVLLSLDRLVARFLRRGCICELPDWNQALALSVFASIPLMVTVIRIIIIHHLHSYVIMNVIIVIVIIITVIIVMMIIGITLFRALWF